MPHQITPVTARPLGVLFPPRNMTRKADIVLA